MTMTPQDSWYWVRWRNQLAVFVNILEERPRQSRRELEDMRARTRTSALAAVHEQAVWSGMLRVQAHLEELARDVTDALRTLTNMICLTERLIGEEDTQRMTAPPLGRVPQERSWLTLNQYHRDTAGPAPAPEGERWTPAPGTVPLYREPVNSGHPMPLERAEQAEKAPGSPKTSDWTA